MHDMKQRQAEFDRKYEQTGRWIKRIWILAVISSVIGFIGLAALVIVLIRFLLLNS